MAHFAQISNGAVGRIIVVSNDDCDGGVFPSSEPVGQTFIALNGLTGTWKQTSYNSNFRKQYASIGYTYDSVADVFILPEPYPSWTLDSNHDWQPPTSRPEVGMWSWNETKLAWDETDNF